MFLIYLAGMSNGIYGLLNVLGGVSQLRLKKIQVWAAWLMILFGILLLVAGVTVVMQNYIALPLLLIGLIAIHFLTLNNGMQMYKKINAKHHLIRVGISIFLIVLTANSF